ncbi:MAG: ABC transporter substrate-binding protein [Chloroflexota bacterium]|nr:ABC transporter substrate-binding protein [Chloroflexota bacterium]
MKVQLQFRALNAHELILHEIAVRQKHYEAEDLDVELVDGTQPGVHQQQARFSVGIGGSLIQRLQTGTPWTAVLVATDYPLFWLVGRHGFAEPTALRGKRLAVHPPHAAPAMFSRIVLSQHSLDLDRDCQLVVVQDRLRDDAEKLGLLQSGEVDAAIVGSRVAPSVYERLGFELLLTFGDSFRFSTTGLAVNTALVALDDPLVSALARATRRALADLHEQPEAATEALERILLESSQEDALRFRALLTRTFSRDGRPARERCMTGLARLAQALGINRAPAFEDVYRTR